MKYCFKHEFIHPCPVCNMKIVVPSRAGGKISPGDIEPGRVPEWLRIGTLKDNSKDVAKAKTVPNY